MMETRESRHPYLKEAMPSAVMAMGDSSKTTGCGRSTCLGEDFRKYGTFATGKCPCSVDDSAQVESGNCVLAT